MQKNFRCLTGFWSLWYFCKIFWCSFHHPLISILPYLHCLKKGLGLNLIVLPELIYGVIWLFSSFHFNWCSRQQTSQVRRLFRIVRNCHNAAAAIWSCHAFRRNQKAKVGSKENWGGKQSQTIRNFWRDCSVSRYTKRN